MNLYGLASFSVNQFHQEKLSCCHQSDLWSSLHLDWIVFKKKLKYTLDVFRAMRSWTFYWIFIFFEITYHIHKIALHKTQQNYWKLLKQSIINNLHQFLQTCHLSATLLEIVFQQQHFYHMYILDEFWNVRDRWKSPKSVQWKSPFLVHQK